MLRATCSGRLAPTSTESTPGRRRSHASDRLAIDVPSRSATPRIANSVAQLDAQLSQVPSSEFDSSDGILTVAEGALFNQRLGEIESSAIHNPFLTEALLLSSMDAVEDFYGIAPSIAPEDIARRLAEISR